MITGCDNVACRLIMKEGSLAGCLVHLNAGSSDRMAYEDLQIPKHAIIGHYPAGFLMLVCLSDSPLSHRSTYLSP